jgi:hypothetical protein
VFGVGNNGAVIVYWVDGASAWQGSLAISPPGTSSLATIVAALQFAEDSNSHPASLWPPWR